MNAISSLTASARDVPLSDAENGEALIADGREASAFMQHIPETNAKTSFAESIGWQNYPGTLDPTQPLDLTDPAQPLDLTDPAQPLDLTDPAQPLDLTDPQNRILLELDTEIITITSNTDPVVIASSGSPVGQIDAQDLDADGLNAGHISATGPGQHGFTQISGGAPVGIYSNNLGYVDPSFLQNAANSEMTNTASQLAAFPELSNNPNLNADQISGQSDMQYALLDRGGAGTDGIISTIDPQLGSTPASNSSESQGGHEQTDLTPLNHDNLSKTDMAAARQDNIELDQLARQSRPGQLQPGAVGASPHLGAGQIDLPPASHFEPAQLNRQNRPVSDISADRTLDRLTQSPPEIDDVITSKTPDLVLRNAETGKLILARSNLAALETNSGEVPATGSEGSAIRHPAFTGSMASLEIQLGQLPLLGLQLANAPFGSAPASLMSQASAQRLSMHGYANLETGLVKAAKSNKGVAVQLDPPELGRVYIDFQFETGRGVTAVIRPEFADTSQLLQDQSNWLSQTLSANGFDEVNIQFASPDSQDFGFSGHDQDGTSQPALYEPDNQSEIIGGGEAKGALTARMQYAQTADGPLNLKL